MRKINNPSKYLFAETFESIIVLTIFHMHNFTKKIRNHINEYQNNLKMNDDMQILLMIYLIGKFFCNQF